MLAKVPVKPSPIIETNKIDNYRYEKWRLMTTKQYVWCIYSMYRAWYVRFHIIYVIMFIVVLITSVLLKNIHKFLSINYETYRKKRDNTLYIPLLYIIIAFYLLWQQVLDSRVKMANLKLYIILCNILYGWWHAYHDKFLFF